EYDVGKDVPSIVPSTSKKSAGKKIPQNVVEVPIDKVSFHFPENAQRWMFIFHRRLALEREIGKEALECEDIVNLIKDAGLLKIVWGNW
ncbi:envelope-like protein, partial [Trifolium medium]|nr:envelope-like protein [Trifolium medium]